MASDKKETCKELCAREHLYTAQEAAEILKYNPQHLRRLCKAGALAHIRRGGRIFFSQADIEAAFEHYSPAPEEGDAPPRTADMTRKALLRGGSGPAAGLRPRGGAGRPCNMTARAPVSPGARVPGAPDALEVGPAGARAEPLPPSDPPEGDGA